MNFVTKLFIVKKNIHCSRYTFNSRKNAFSYISKFELEFKKLSTCLVLGISLVFKLLKYFHKSSFDQQQHSEKDQHKSVSIGRSSL